MREHFRRFAHRTSVVVGSPWAFLAAVSVIVLWGLSGPIFHFSDTWQLVINTGTTIVTFLMVFLIQNTQNRDAMAIHLKLDELIAAVQRASNTMIDVENLSDEELAQLQRRFEQLGRQAHHRPMAFLLTFWSFALAAAMLAAVIAAYLLPREDL